LARLTRRAASAFSAATAEGKTALEGERHGAFTQILLDGLGGKAHSNRDGNIEVFGIAEYVQNQLPEFTKRKWGIEQFPFVDIKEQSFAVLPKP
jgi:hypothetical protein